MGYNDSNRAPKIDEVAYVPESGKQTAPWLKGKIVGINHDNQEVLVSVDGSTKLIRAFTNKIMFGENLTHKSKVEVE